jgi:CHAT domain-containing protein
MALIKIHYPPFLIKCLLLISTISIQAQCLDRDSLWKRLCYFRDSPGIPSNQQLSELLKYDSGANLCSYHYDSIRAFLQQRIGVAYFKLADYSRAESFLKSAIAVIERGAGRSYINESHLVRDYYTLSVVYTTINQPFKKAKAEDSCIAVATRTHTIDAYVLMSLLERTESLYETGDFHRCIEYSNEGERITSKIMYGKDSLSYAFNFFIWKVNALYFLGEFNEAENLLEKEINKSKRSVPNTHTANIYELMASVKTEKKFYKEAAKYYNQSLDIYRKNKLYNNCMATMVNMGYYLYKIQLHHYDSAIYCFNQALQFASLIQKGKDVSDSAKINTQKLNIYENIAHAYIGKSVFDSAAFYFDLAYTQVVPGYVRNELPDLRNLNSLQENDLVYLLYALLDEADGYIKEYKTLDKSISLIKAAEIYSVADKLQGRINAHQIEIKSRLFWRNQLRNLYEKAIETHYLLSQPDEAFYYFERSRAVLLSEQLFNEHSIKNEDILNLGRVKQKILNLNRGLSDPASINHRAEIQSKLFSADQELTTLEQTIKEHDPVYYQNLVDTSKIRLNKVREKILKDHEALIEFYDGDSNVYVCSITKKNATLTKLDKIDFVSTTSKYRSFIADPTLLNQHFTEFTQISFHLYRLLMGNLNFSNGRIIISLDGPFFPFESLVTHSDPNATSYFIDSHAVSYTYSARFLLNDFKKINTSTTGYFLGVAPVRYPGSFKLADLSQSDLSLGNISSAFRKTLTLTHAQASKRNFLQNYAGYKIIQLYTHASETSIYAEPVIYFADSALYLSDLIPENKPAAQLIVLSACETGNGKLYKGEGVFSFNRGFASLGIPSSVTNLWSVDNESTYRITELFYQYISKGLPLDVSLQKAKLDFIASSSKEKKLPYYWAASILVGKTDPVEMSQSFPWKLLLIIIGSTAAILLFILSQRKNKRPPLRNDSGIL